MYKSFEMLHVLGKCFEQFKFVCKGGEDALLPREYAEKLSDMVKIINHYKIWLVN